MWQEKTDRQGRRGGLRGLFGAVLIMSCQSAVATSRRCGPRDPSCAANMILIALSLARSSESEQRLALPRRQLAANAYKRLRRLCAEH
jgi:hypothetical protein